MKPPVRVESLILSIRDQKMIIDADLAELYGVATKALNQAVKRNADRFHGDFAFQLTTGELNLLRSQIVDLKTTILSGSIRWRFAVTICDLKAWRSAHSPYAFTEHGAHMAANVLTAPRLSP